MEETMKKLFAAIVVIAILSLTVHAQSVDEVVANYLKAIGADSLKAVNSMEAKAKMVDNRGIEMQMTIWLKRPNLVKTEILVGPQKVEQAYDGKTAWAIAPQMGSLDPMVLPETQASQVKDTFEMIEDPLMDYKGKGHTIELLGKEEVDGKTYYKLKLIKKGSRESTMYIDAKNFLLHKISLMQKGGGMEYPMDLIFDDYRDVSGAKLCYKVSAVMNGQNAWTMTFEYLKTNVDIDDSIFQMPKK